MTKSSLLPYGSLAKQRIAWVMCWLKSTCLPCRARGTTASAWCARSSAVSAASSACRPPRWASGARTPVRTSSRARHISVWLGVTQQPNSSKTTSRVRRVHCALLRRHRRPRRANACKRYGALHVSGLRASVTRSLMWSCPCVWGSATSSRPPATSRRKRRLVTRSALCRALFTRVPLPAQNQLM
jgi:hypothetical protein